MRRTLLALVVGIAAGAGLAATLMRVMPASGVASSASPAPRLLAPPPSGAAGASLDADFHRRLADAGAAELDAMFARTAAARPSGERELALAMLLQRYADLDTDAALQRAREAGVGGLALGAVYGAWARSNPAAALAALRTIDRPSDAADAGAAIVEALGNDRAAIERVAAVLAERDPDPPMPTTAPSPAMLANLVPFSAQPSALQLLAERWATFDPDRALTLARDFSDERLRTTFETAGVRALARTAPDAAFAHLASADLDSRRRGLLSALGELSRANPERVLALAEDFPAEVRRFTQSAALRQLAEQDPLAAARFAGSLPPGAERQSLMQLAARGYGKRDAAAALEWARSRPDQNLVASVIGGIAESDPRQALDLALALDSPAERMSSLQTVLGRAALASDDEVAATADRLAALGDPSIRSMQDMILLPQWVSRSPDAALRWLIANGTAAAPGAFQQVGQRVAANDPRVALAYSAEIPAAAREAWVRGVVQGYARHDAGAAVEWLGQFRAEPWYAATAAGIATTVAQHDGSAAARLLDEVDPAGTGTESAQIASIVANAWANRDPPAAAQWAVARPTAEQRALAVEAAVGSWAMRDPAAARAWGLQLPASEHRDRALSRLLTMTAYQTPGAALDATILSAFDSEAARQQAVLKVVRSMSGTDGPRARSFADAHLTDPELRAQAEQALAERPRSVIGSQAINAIAIP